MLARVSGAKSLSVRDVKAFGAESAVEVVAGSILELKKSAE